MKFPILIASLLTSMTITAADFPDRQNQIPSVAKEDTSQYLVPRHYSQIPEGEFGDKVRNGYQLFVNTQSLRDIYVGNDLNCVNCHMDAGRKANASPFWAAFFAYPAYRKKNDKVNSFEERIQGCFNYSMNGKAPPAGSPELVALSAYSYWLSMGGLLDSMQVIGDIKPLTDEQLLTGGKVDNFPLPNFLKEATTVEGRAKLAGRGYPKIPVPVMGYSIELGAKVYQSHCLVCHGAQGQGLAIAGIYSLPPLWGSQSFNWGAGMHRVNTAAYFVYENMPFGKSFQLSHQQAWNVAAYVNANERPQDPRSKGDLAELKAKYHKHPCYYGEAIDEGEMLGVKSFANFPSLTEKNN